MNLTQKFGLHFTLVTVFAALNTITGPMLEFVQQQSGKTNYNLPNNINLLLSELSLEWRYMGVSQEYSQELSERVCEGKVRDIAGIL